MIFVLILVKNVTEIAMQLHSKNKNLHKSDVRFYIDRDSIRSENEFPFILCEVVELERIIYVHMLYSILRTICYLALQAEFACQIV